MNSTGSKALPSFLSCWRGCQRPARRGDGGLERATSISTCLLNHTAQCFGRECGQLSPTSLETLSGLRAAGRNPGRSPRAPLCGAERGELDCSPSYHCICCRLPACSEPGRTVLTACQGFCEILFLSCFVLFSWPGHSPKARL